MFLYYLFFYISLVSADNVILFNMEESLQDSWNSSQHDGDTDLSANKWRAVGGNPYMFYTCNIQGKKQDNFLRTPYIRTNGYSYIYIELYYKIQSCADTRPGVTKNNCAQSIHLHMKETNDENDSQRVDEYTYRLANEAYTSIIPRTTTDFERTTVPVKLSGSFTGVFFALRDTGACVRLRELNVFARYCPESVKEAVRYRQTRLNGSDVLVTGVCVPNATHPADEPPIKSCRAERGEWQDDLQKSGCKCDRGFELYNEYCRECESGYFKVEDGNKEQCRPCPAQSSSLPGYTYKCECLEGYRRVDESRYELPCIAPPPPPDVNSVRVVEKEKFSVTVTIPETHLQYDISIGEISRQDSDLPMSVAQATFTVDSGKATITDLRPATEYLVKVKVMNGSVESIPVTLIVKTDSEEQPLAAYLPYLAGGVGLLVLIIVVVSVSVCVCRRTKRQRRHRDPCGGNLGTVSTIRSATLSNAKYVPVSSFAERQDLLMNARNIKRNELELKEVCGKGQFGTVWRGVYSSPTGERREVAVKVAKDNADLGQEFKFEASIMVQFNDPHVIELVGLVYGDSLMIVTEYMKNGCLKDYLSEIKGMRTPTNLLAMARGIVLGMKYLADMKFIHRDLAARNILVDDKDFCKVSDFGLSHILEENTTYYKPKGNFPVRWTSPEAIVHLRYTEKSDVYSMGVVLWEMFTFGEEPWSGYTNEQVLVLLKDRVKMERPKDCPERVYQTMLKCWHDDFMKRPTFAELQIEIESLMSILERNVTIDMPADEDCLSVGKWLASMGLQQYQSHFMNTGWDRLDGVRLMEDEDLQKIGITLAGHRKKLKTAIDTMNEYIAPTWPDTLSSSHSMPRYNSLPSPGPGYFPPGVGAPQRCGTLK